MSWEKVIPLFQPSYQLFAFENEYAGEKCLMRWMFQVQGDVRIKKRSNLRPVGIACHRNEQMRWSARSRKMKRIVEKKAPDISAANLPSEEKPSPLGEKERQPSQRGSHFFP